MHLKDPRIVIAKFISPQKPENPRILPFSFQKQRSEENTLSPVVLGSMAADMGGWQPYTRPLTLDLLMTPNHPMAFCTLCRNIPPEQPSRAQGGRASAEELLAGCMQRNEML